MKLVIGAALAALALAVTPAVAQQTAPAAVPASRCAAIPAAPTLPDGANARESAMTQGNRTYTEWGEQTNSVLACRRAEAEELTAASVAARNHAETRVQEFNAGVRGQCTVIRQWLGEVTEYNRRNGQEPPAALPADHPCNTLQPAPAQQ
ncbi:MAG: hypothetical protein AB7J28_14495 [Hyphomonadaceae bacterium]